MATKATKGMSTPLQRGRSRNAAPRRGSVVDAMKERGGDGEGRLIAVADIQPNPDNPTMRSRPDQALVNSIREVGVIQDLVLVPVDVWLAEHPGREGELTDAPYLILAGHKRLAAAKAAERDEVPARIREDFDATTLDSVVLHENLHRMALTPLEEAEAYRRIMDRRGLSQRALAKHVGVSQSQISKKLKLLDLPTGLQAAVAEGLVGIEESALVLEEPAAVVEVVDQAIALAAEGDEVDLTRLVADSRMVVRAQEARTAAQQQADQRKAPFVEATDLRRALSLSGSEDTGARRLREDTEIAAAQKNGTLVVSVSPAKPWGGGGDVEFFTTEKPPKPSSPEQVKSQKATPDYQRQKANKARRAALVDIVKSPPKTDAIRRELLAWAITGGGWDSEVCRIARPLLEDAGLITEGLNYWDILRDLPELSERQQYHATWILMLARRDERVGRPLHSNSWQQSHVDHYTWLMERGYEPGEWEQDMLDAALDAALDPVFDAAYQQADREVSDDE